MSPLDICSGFYHASWEILLLKASSLFPTSLISPHWFPPIFFTHSSFPHLNKGLHLTVQTFVTLHENKHFILLKNLCELKVSFKNQVDRGSVFHWLGMTIAYLNNMCWKYYVIQKDLHFSNWFSSIDIRECLGWKGNLIWTGEEGRVPDDKEHNFT